MSTTAGDLLIIFNKLTIGKNKINLLIEDKI